MWGEIKPACITCIIGGLDMTNRRLTTLTIVFALAVIPISVAAQDGFTVDVVATADCGVATFKTSIKDGEGPYDLIWDFGDADSDEMIGISELSIDVTHPYTDTGDYVWEVNERIDIH
jgi:hypothetical protein